MESYIAIHNFMPKKSYPNSSEIEIKVDEAINNLSSQEFNTKELQEIKALKACVIACMNEYNHLTGVTEKVLNDYISYSPNGILPQYVGAILKYFVDSSFENKEINILKYSGIKEIKIRYKHADSVIKKLVNSGFKDLNKIKEQTPTKVFLRGGLLHDLIGIQFICAYPYQSEWLARALYHFFKIPNRTDDHLLYGFYNIDRSSGYKGLHCDRTYWHPAFDSTFINSEEKEILPKDIKSFTTEKFSESKNILKRYHKVFNVEIQIHTGFQSIWAKMEHEKSYDILAKGKGKLDEITVLWKMLSDNLSSIETQFQKLQVKTEQSVYQDDVKDGYGFISNILEKETETYLIFNKSVKKTKKIRKKLREHEIARIDYVKYLEKEINYLKMYLSDNPNLEKSSIFSIRLQIAFIYYSFANHRVFFNDKDLGNFLKNSVLEYKNIIKDLNSKPEYSAVQHKNLMLINAIIRYGRLTQKYGLGLVNKDILNNEDIPHDIQSQNTTQADGLQYVGYGLHAFTNLNNNNMSTLKNDSSSFYRTIHYFDRLARDIELSNDISTPINIEGKEVPIKELIQKFRIKYMNQHLVDEFISLLEGKRQNKMTNTSFILGFLSTLVINKLIRPIDILQKVVNLSSHDTIKASDIFLYEYAAYEFTLSNGFNDAYIDENTANHHRNYHYQNMINLLFRIKKEEDIYEFIKAKTYFNKIKDRDEFQEDYLSSKFIKY